MRHQEMPDYGLKRFRMRRHPIGTHNGDQHARIRDDLMRISVAMYTEREDVERLLDALANVLNLSRSPA